ncbi:NitT/TauT family transport system substrate-binding protein [Spirosoma oryzae]|uniref:Thiamine pyrimidine synthase n=1 Tax=Spirosoma oryzae TaxID=1469603 RepID=A0A2T0T5D5_9BACT|nr:ABC transporter substrate-binding protein [Spirosoma oryzae]PRY40877.1 NitT/TauT family transport system substrate-binding protein [Spirosoma oryzae]
MPTRIRLALDWTPNTNHTGFYVALANGNYEKADLQVELISPDADDYKLTPARRVAAGEADLAIAPSESIISFQTNNVPMLAVAAVLARDASAIVTLKQSGLDRPSRLDGKVYASYNARYEDEIIRQLIINDGGRGQFVSHKPARLDIWHALLTNEADATWIFLPWEGVEAEQRDIQLNQFLLEDYEIPYGYSPVLAAHSDWATENADALRRFLSATAEGFAFAVRDPDEAARILFDTAAHPSLTSLDFLEKSQQVASGYYLDAEGQWGVMRRDIWNTFVNWLIRNHLLNHPDGDLIQQYDVSRLYTNDYL